MPSGDYQLYAFALVVSPRLATTRPGSPELAIVSADSARTSSILLERTLGTHRESGHVDVGRTNEHAEYDRWTTN